jgi:hypothetical protein
MINFPKPGNVQEPPVRKLTPGEYLRFCDFCIRANPHITPENCMDRKSGEEEIKVPFRVC